MNQVVKIALGILLASMLTFGARLAYVSYMGHVLNEKMQENAERQKKVSEARKLALIKREQKLKEQLERDKREIRLNKQLELKKQHAWNKYYKEPEGCDVFKTDKHMVECINHKMRAKKKFERLYSKNK